MQYLKEDVRKKILSSALTEFEANGYIGASMRDIASRSGIALGSTYRYFKNKEELFNTLIEPVYDKMISYLNKIQVKLNNSTVENCDQTVEFMEDILNKIIEFVKDSSNELLIVFNKSKGSKYENFKEELVTLTNNIFLRATNENLKKEECDRIIIYTIAHDLIEGVSFILKQHYDGEKVKVLINKLLHFYIKNLGKRFQTA